MAKHEKPSPKESGAPEPQEPFETHYIIEWAERRGLSQADIAREIGVDKSTVTRWFKGSVPEVRHWAALRECLGLDEPTDIFRHPDNDWLSKRFRDRDAEERRKMIETLDFHFPPKKRA
jgi:transcriptional regulator with XRE-family HTH domain